MFERLEGAMHRSFLGTDISAYLYGQPVSFADGLPGKDGSGKGACEAVTCPDGIGNLHLGRFHEARQVGSKDIAAVHTTSQDDHVQTVLLEQTAASVFDGMTIKSEHLSDNLQLLVVNLQYVAGKQVVINDFFRIELLPKVDIKDFQAVLWRVSKELLYGVSAYLAALS